jgi:hypothetical protein
VGDRLGVIPAERSAGKPEVPFRVSEPVLRSFDALRD